MMFVWLCGVEVWGVPVGCRGDCLVDDETGVMDVNFIGRIIPVWYNLLMTGLVVVRAL